MQITFTLNHKKVTAEIAADTVLLDLVRSLGCKSVKRGCETANCGLCTVFLDEKPVLSCSVLAARVNGRSVTTLEGAAGGGCRVRRLYRRSGCGAVRLLQPGLYYERAGAFPGKPRPRRGRNQGSIWPATSAAAPAMRASCGGILNF